MQVFWIASIPILGKLHLNKQDCPHCGGSKVIPLWEARKNNVSYARGVGALLSPKRTPSCGSRISLSTYGSPSLLTLLRQNPWTVSLNASSSTTKLYSPCAIRYSWFPVIMILSLAMYRSRTKRLSSNAKKDVNSLITQLETPQAWGKNIQNGYFK